VFIIHFYGWFKEIFNLKRLLPSINLTKYVLIIQYTKVYLQFIFQAFIIHGVFMFHLSTEPHSSRNISPFACNERECVLYGITENHLFVSRIVNSVMIY
jgi:hypothetical protein